MRHPCSVLVLAMVFTASFHAQSRFATQPIIPVHGADSCPVDLTPGARGDQQLARDDYKGAELTFRADLGTQPRDLDAHLGLVRALIGQDRTSEAEDEAVAMLRAAPKASLAQVAVSEAAFRSAKLGAALAHAQEALELDPCNARAAAALAKISSLLSFYGRAAQLIAQAHRLRPNDELIRRFWISSLPRKERQAELLRYLQEPHALSAEGDQVYRNILTHLTASHPGECRITSKAESAHIPLQPITGNRGQPLAFGLDVDFNNTHRRMQIDTGASGIILTPAAAEALQLQPEYRLKAGGVGDEGKVDSYLSHVASITIGDIQISDCMVEVLGKSKINVDGLIGMNVFSPFLVTLDYPNAQLDLDPLPRRPIDAAALANAALNDTGTDPRPQDRYTPPEFKDWIQIFRIGHELLLPAFFKIGAPQHYMIMDTGASSTILSLAMAKEAGTLHNSSTHFVGLSGEANNIFETKPTQLFVANLKLPPEPYFVYDTTSVSHNNGFETSGFFGLHTLQRLTIQIDYRDNLLNLTYSRKHDIIRF